MGRIKKQVKKIRVNLEIQIIDHDINASSPWTGNKMIFLQEISRPSSHLILYMYILSYNESLIQMHIFYHIIGSKKK